MSQYKIMFSLILALSASGLMAQEVTLTASLETPVLLAGQPHRTFLKIGVQGFEWTRNGDRAPLNVALVLDRSGSMEGEKLERAKEAARYAVGLLGNRDILSLVTYESEVQVLLPATRIGDRRRILQLIDTIETDGSTALFAGVTQGARELRKFLSREQVNRVILLSDGLANVGPSRPGELAELGSSLRREGISVSTIGLGLDFNEDLMTRLAQSSDGNHAFVQEPRDLVRIFDFEFKDALSVVARDVEVRIQCAPGIRPLRLLNREGEIRGQTITLSLNQVYSLQEKYFLVEVEVPSLRPGSSQPVAEVETGYFNLRTGRTASRTATAQVTGTTNLQDQLRSRNKDVAEAVALQKNVEAGEEAIRLRDAGQIQAAKEVLTQAAADLKKVAVEIDSEVLAESSAAVEEDAVKLEDEAQWNAQRKSMRALQYSTETQQSY